MSHFIAALVSGGVLGGILAAVINWTYSAQSERRKRKVDRLCQQLELLYGPLHFFCAQNQTLHRHGAAIDAAYKEIYVDTKYADSSHENVMKQARKTIDINNKYTQLVRENNKRICEILLTNFSQIDVEDTEPFQEFVLHCRRDEIELLEGGIALPYEVHQHVGNIVFYRSEFTDLVRKRFRDKHLELRGLERPWNPNVDEGVP